MVAEMARNCYRTPSLRGLEQAVAISFALYVMLSESEASRGLHTIHRLRDLEILHFVQNDIVSVHNDAVYSADIVSAITNC